MHRPIQRIHKIVRICKTVPIFGGMGITQTVCVVLSAAERKGLAAIVADRNRPRKHVERARIVRARRIPGRRSAWRKASA